MLRWAGKGPSCLGGSDAFSRATAHTSTLSHSPKTALTGSSKSSPGKENNEALDITSRDFALHAAMRQCPKALDLLPAEGATSGEIGRLESCSSPVLVLVC